MVPARRRGGKFKEIPPKFKSSTWAIWSAFTARISNSSTKQMCAESGLGALRSRQEPLCPPSAGSRGLLPKLNNKWWDGYQSQKVVIMEDVDKETVKFLHHHLKIWADRWGFIGETKGARLPHSPMAGSNFQLQHHGHPQGPRGPPAQGRPSLVGSCGLRCSAATRSRTGTPTRPSPPRLWPPSLNE